MEKIALLNNRGVLQLSGADRLSFLQGMVSNDVSKAVPGQAVWAALLTPQGKWIADFFILSDGGCFLLDCERAQVADISRLLSRFKLRSQIGFEDLSDRIFVHAAWGPQGPVTDDKIVVQAPDPRLEGAGLRILSASPLPTNATLEDWDAHRISLGLPDGSRDLEPEKTVLLEAGFDELQGVSWTKGCYMGQELTARTKYRGLVKRRLIPVQIEGSIPAPGTPILQDGREVGTMRSALGNRGLAILRLDALTNSLTCNETKLIPSKPSWMVLQQQ
jgi:folate-binding protein YgfZ